MNSKQFDLKLFESEVAEIAKELKQGQEEAFFKLRKQIVDLVISKISDKVEKEQLFLIYFLKKIINDFCINLATDASFSFELPEDKFKDFLKNLGLLCDYLGKINDAEKNIFEYLIKLIDLYYFFIKKMEENYGNK